jgi:hypothetical protein
MVTLLQTEADKVMRTNQRLSATLRRLLDARAHAERQQVARLLREIRGYAAALAANPPHDVELELELEAGIESPFRRTFWVEPLHFEAMDLTDYEVDENSRREAFQRLAAMHRLDWREMRHRIKQLVDVNGVATLRELLQIHPPESGVIEVLGYVQIACDDGHLVNPSVTQEVLVPATTSEESSVLITVPLVTFTVAKKNPHARRSA